jgi:hypothetical protein
MLSLSDVAFDEADGVEVNWRKAVDARVARVLVAMAGGYVKLKGRLICGKFWKTDAEKAAKYLKLCLSNLDVVGAKGSNHCW